MPQALHQVGGYNNYGGVYSNGQLPSYGVHHAAASTTAMQGHPSTTLSPHASMYSPGSLSAGQASHLHPSGGSPRNGGPPSVRAPLSPFMQHSGAMAGQPMAQGAPGMKTALSHQMSRMSFKELQGGPHSTAAAMNLSPMPSAPLPLHGAPGMAAGDPHTGASHLPPAKHRIKEYFVSRNPDIVHHTR